MLSLKSYGLGLYRPGAPFRIDVTERSDGGAGTMTLDNEPHNLGYLAINLYRVCLFNGLIISRKIHHPRIHPCRLLFVTLRISPSITLICDSSRASISP